MPCPMREGRAFTLYHSISSLGEQYNKAIRCEFCRVGVGALLGGGARHMFW